MRYQALIKLFIFLFIHFGASAYCYTMLYVKPIVLEKFTYTDSHKTHLIRLNLVDFNQQDVVGI